MNGENTPSSSTATNLQAQVDSLRKLLVVTLVVLFVFSGAINLYLLRQVITVRKALAAEKATIDQFTKVELPNIEAFTSALQTFAKTHPDLNPILARYNLAPTTNSMFTPAPTTPKATK